MIRLSYRAAQGISLSRMYRLFIELSVMNSTTAAQPRTCSSRVSSYLSPMVRPSSYQIRQPDSYSSLITGSTSSRSL